MATKTVTAPGDIEARLADMEDKLRALSDKQEIYETLLRYCRGVDRLDAALASSALIQEELPGSLGWKKQTEAIEALRKSSKVVQHFIGNVLIELDGDKATSEVYFFANQIQERGGKDHLRVKAARYLQWWSRTRDGWKIAGMRVLDDYNEIAPLGEPAPNSEKWVYGLRSHEDPVYHMKDVTP